MWYSSRACWQARHTLLVSRVGVCSGVFGQDLSPTGEDTVTTNKGTLRCLPSGSIGSAVVAVGSGSIGRGGSLSDEGLVLGLIDLVNCGGGATIVGLVHVLLSPDFVSIGLVAGSGVNRYAAEGSHGTDHYDHSIPKESVIDDFKLADDIIPEAITCKGVKPLDGIEAIVDDAAVLHIVRVVLVIHVLPP